MPATAADPSSLMDLYCSQFTLQPVDVSDDRIYALRYRVFCEELGLPMKFTERGESDSFDEHARHFLLSQNGEDVGYIRMLLGGVSGLPCEDFGFKHADPARLDLRSVNVARTCEASRLAIIADARRPVRYTDLEGKDRVLQVGLFALYAAAFNTVIQEGASHLFMVGEPRLQKHIDRTGFHMMQGSEPFEYLGQRALFFYPRQALLRDIQALPKDRQDMLRLVGHQIKPDRTRQQDQNVA